MKAKYILTIVLCSALISGCRFSRNEEWYIPEDHRGWLIIIPNREDGIEERIENGNLIQEFPKSGVLKTQYDIPNGFRRVRYFLVGDGGTKRELEYLDAEEVENLEVGEPYISRIEPVNHIGDIPYKRWVQIVLTEKGSDKTYGYPGENRSDAFLLNYAKESGDIEQVAAGNDR